MRTLSSLCLIMLLSLFEAEAATITLQASATALAGHPATVGGGTPEEALSASREQVAASSDPQTGAEATARYSASADAQSGRLTFVLSGEAQGGVCRQGVACGAGAGASAFVDVFETLVVSGSGTLTALMDVSANWDSPEAFNFISSVSLSARGLGVVQGDDVDSINLDSFNEPSEGAINQRLSASAIFENAQDLQVFAGFRIQGQSGASAQNGLSQTMFLDAGNTALFTLMVDSGLAVTPLDPGFLSDPLLGGGVTPIPLPSTAPLLASCLAVMMAARRIKRRSWVRS